MDDTGELHTSSYPGSWFLHHALVILCMLAKDSDDAKQRIANADNAIESIVHSLGRHVGERKHAVALLLELTKCDLVREYIGKVQGCKLLLVTMSSSDDNQAARDATELLENLSYSDQNVLQMAKANYFKHLLQHLSTGLFFNLRNFSRINSSIKFLFLIFFC